MTKRFNSVLTLEDPFNTTLSSCKRQKCFFVGKQCFQYVPPRPTSSSSTRNHAIPKFRHLTTFMNLPFELREMIFSYAFEELIQPLAHPYDDLPAHHRFQIYATLRLCNRQIGYEVKKLFEKHFIDRITFYFDNGPELYDLWKEVEKHPRLKNAAFYLRAKNFDDVDGKERPGENKLTESTEELMETQPGFKFDWSIIAPGFYRYQFHGSQRWLQRPGWEGFKVVDGGHHPNCGDDCVNYKIVQYPPLEKSLRLRSFVWNADFADPSSAREEKTQQVGTLALEGRVCDLDWSCYDVDRAREQVAVHHGVEMDSDPYDYDHDRESEVHLDDYRLDLDGEVESDPGIIEDISGESEDASTEEDW
ncbi:uncharacterized protein RCC_09955 [Ramularia collo-cygni]|uniref:Uncharacterized protein n=1 Tax=Ramularia collo-cygni TaxID=112498 RepID=A0A2D3V1N9_9PEZI|nr:uncharacterized protein RCC_09955 [Ramularia collo-cygni]CZT24237.1 uncharacterized protein RCC_09955 [Ramularia collo-cygni]